MNIRQKYSKLSFGKLLLIILLFLNGFVFCQASKGNDNPEEPVSEQYGSGSNLLLSFYQTVLSPVKGGNGCPMYPSCSQYSKIAFSTLPFPEAYARTFDRIMRCGHELSSYPQIRVNGFIKWYDPVTEDTAAAGMLIAGRADIINTEANKEDIHADNTFCFDSCSVNFTGIDARFAEFLYKSGSFSRASSEYLRLSFYEKDSIRKAEYLFKSGLCLYSSGDYQGFLQFAGNNRNSLSAFPALKAETDFYEAKSSYGLKSYYRAITVFDIAEMNNAAGYGDELNYYRGLSYARLFFWNEAFKNMSKVKDSSPYKEKAERIIKLLPEAQQLPSLSPFFAGFASAVIPGSGYLYAHRTGTAVTSFVVNTLLAWTVYTAVKKDNYALASLTFFFGSGWYLGNIYGSSEAAKDYNRNIRSSFLEKAGIED